MIYGAILDDKALIRVNDLRKVLAICFPANRRLRWSTELIWIRLFELNLMDSPKFRTNLTIPFGNHSFESQRELSVDHSVWVPCEFPMSYWNFLVFSIKENSSTRRLLSNLRAQRAPIGSESGRILLGQKAPCCSCCNLIKFNANDLFYN